jgi:hypothetical protein
LKKTGKLAQAAKGTATIMSVTKVGPKMNGRQVAMQSDLLIAIDARRRRCEEMQQ